MIPALFVLALFAGLVVAHFVARRIPHRPAKQEIAEARTVLAEDAYSSLLDMGSEEDDPDWRPVFKVYSADDYRKMRRQS